MTVFEASYIRDKYFAGWSAVTIAARLNDRRDMHLPILRLCDVVDHIDLIETIERADYGTTVSRSVPEMGRGSQGDGDAGTRRAPHRT